MISIVIPLIFLQDVKTKKTVKVENSYQFSK